MESLSIKGNRHIVHGDMTENVSGCFFLNIVYTFGSLFTAKQNDGYLRTNAEQHTCQLCGHRFYFCALRCCCELRNQHMLSAVQTAVL